ncbi:sugar isomerase domain-containing protein [Microbacterium sp.]|uniref:sugar isomerase domain-containing protein n=1 Tax=Microbacterium sp. TaxID=51671 RepID=UPI0037CC11DB
MSDDSPAYALEYLATAAGLLGHLAATQSRELAAAADLVADAVRAGRSIHAFGTGHSHMLAEELFYRAGGLVNVRPILFEGLMLHASAPLSTALERLSGLAAALVDDHEVAAGDVVVVASNSGSNAVTVELVAEVQRRGAATIAITSIAHATSGQARLTGRPKLHEVATVTIDNGGIVGDAAIAVPGLDRRVAPTSTVVGAAALNAIVAEAVGRLVATGVTPAVFASSNTAGGDAINASLLHGNGTPA